MIGDSWTHKIARICVLPLVNTSISPNHITVIRLITGLLACAAFASKLNILGGIFWLISTFLDRADGELARISGKTTEWGHKFDYYCDTFITALFFIAIGINLRDNLSGYWSISLGICAALGVIFTEIYAEIIDQKKQSTGEKAYPGIMGFDFDDILYLFAPIVWLNWHLPFLIGASIGAPAFAIFTWYSSKKI
jgi:phosphatidylglycerophosphate synthase